MSKVIVKVIAFIYILCYKDKISFNAMLIIIASPSNYDAPTVSYAYYNCCHKSKSNS